MWPGSLTAAVGRSRERRTAVSAPVWIVGVGEHELDGLSSAAAGGEAVYGGLQQLPTWVDCEGLKSLGGMPLRAVKRGGNFDDQAAGC